MKASAERARQAASLTRLRTAAGRALVALAATFAVAVAPSAAGAVAVPARSADSFVDSIGVNTHTYYTDTVYYSHFDGVKRKLAELGVRHIRENLVPDRPDQYERLRELAAQGVKSTLIVGDPNEGREGLDELVSILGSELRGAVAAAEGPNEFDTWGGADWLPRLAEYQRWLYEEVKADPQLAGLPVVGPSIVHSDNQEGLGDVSGLLDYGNVHSYPDGYSPEDNVSRHLGNAAHNSGTKPVMATESGYHTALGWSGEHKPVSEQAMATYIPRMYLEYFRRGIARTFSYELLDEAAGSGDREDNFGLLRNDLSEKPAFAALRNTIDILEDPGPGFDPGSLDYSLSGDVADIHHLLLQKRDGSFYVALWRAVDVWDPVAQAPEAAPTGSVTLELGRQVSAAEAYSPNVSSGPVASLPVSGSSIAVEVGPEVTIVKLFAGKRLPGRIKVWVSRRSVPAGGRLAVKGRLPKQLAGSRTSIKIQHWRKGKWRAVGRDRTTPRGVFREKVRLPATRRPGATRLRAVARVAKPSRAVRVRIKAGGSQARPATRRARRS
jgi:hypothetical protein